jgi:hypothetical protein
MKSGRLATAGTAEIRGGLDSDIEEYIPVLSSVAVLETVTRNPCPLPRCVKAKVAK